jgi:hypothetical protein
MAYDSKNFVLLAPVASLFVLAILLLSTYNRRKMLGILADKAMGPHVLSNFSAIKYRIKVFICVLVPAIHALILARIRIFDGSSKKIDANQHLLTFLIVLLVVEQLLHTRRKSVKDRGKEIYASLRRDIYENSLP